MIKVSSPKILRKIFSNYIWSIPNNENKIFLTFDDGPTPKITAWVLDILEKYKAKATFFCTGKNVESYPALYSEIINKNHSIGNHSYNHLKGFTTNVKNYLDDFQKANNLIKSTLFRPPYGRMTRRQTAEIIKTHKIIMWNVLSVDYNHKISPKLCFLNVKTFTKSGSIIVFHDSQKAEKNMKYALQATLDYFSERGFWFENISKEVFV